MNVREWAVSVKADLVKLQQERGIPALWAAAQMCHESAVNEGEGLSELARNAHNYAGLKWAEWQREYGCSPVTYGTWEVLNGQRVDLADAFCSCPSWEVWLEIYGELLTGRIYGPALNYAGDPMLYGFSVWKAGWATDPEYMVGTGHWLTAIYGDYEDTLPQSQTARQAAATRESVPIRDANGNRLCEGWLQENRTVVVVREITEALGYTLEWSPTPPAITLKK